MKSPCMNCTPADGRSGDCHPKCERYLEWVELNRQKRNQISEARFKDSLTRHTIEKAYGNRLKRVKR